MEVVVDFTGRNKWLVPVGVPNDDLDTRSKIHNVNFVMFATLHALAYHTRCSGGGRVQRVTSPLKVPPATMDGMSGWQLTHIRQLWKRHAQRASLHHSPRSTWHRYTDNGNRTEHSDSNQRPYFRCGPGLTVTYRRLQHVRRFVLHKVLGKQVPAAEAGLVRAPRRVIHSTKPAHSYN